MIRRRRRSPRPDTACPSATLLRSRVQRRLGGEAVEVGFVDRVARQCRRGGRRQPLAGAPDARALASLRPRRRVDPLPRPRCAGARQADAEAVEDEYLGGPYGVRRDVLVAGGEYVVGEALDGVAHAAGLPCTSAAVNGQRATQRPTSGGEIG